MLEFLAKLINDAQLLNCMAKGCKACKSLQKRCIVLLLFSNIANFAICLYLQYIHNFN